MKKLFLSVSIMAIAACSYAQGISGGLKAGLNFANLKLSGDSDFGSVSFDSRTSFHAGAYLNVAFSEQLSLQPELLFNSTGASLGDEDIKMTYLSVPVLIKWNPAPIFNIHAGPQFGFLLSAKADDEDVKDSFKGLDLGLGIGAGVDLPMGLNFTARYVLGLGNVGEAESFGDGVDIKSNVFQISVGYRLFGAGD